MADYIIPTRYGLVESAANGKTYKGGETAPLTEKQAKAIGAEPAPPAPKPKKDA